MISFTRNLLDWYDQAHRPLPWRLTPLPYYILVSEFMLQQTRMETVLPYFARFITAYPTLSDLAEANEDDLLKLWEGLGYYRRVRHLHQTARRIRDEYSCIVPADPSILKSLPGIGDYVAGAIASTAYQVKVSAIDGNVSRILTRLECIPDDVTKARTKQKLQTILLELLPDERVGDFNQALMELGALVCLPNGEPLCHTCPISKWCCGYQTGTALNFPVKPKKAALALEKRTVLVLTDGKSVLIEQFEPGLLEGLWGFPMLPGHVPAEDIAAAYPKNEITPLPPSKHRFSHKLWDMNGYLIKLESDDQFTPIEELSSRTFPTALKVYRKALDQLEPLR